MLYAFLIAAMRAKCPTYFALLNFITLITHFVNRINHEALNYIISSSFYFFLLVSNILGTFKLKIRLGKVVPVLK